MEKLDALLRWQEAEFIRRTIAVKRNEAPIDWIDPDYRIIISEVMDKAREMGVTESRVTLQPKIVRTRAWINRIEKADIGALERRLASF